MLLVKSAVLMLLAATSMADSNSFTINVNGNGKKNSPIVKIPDNFKMETTILIEKEDGSWWDPMTRAEYFYDSQGNRYRYNVLNNEGQIIETTVSDYNNQITLKYTSDGSCTKG